MGDKSASNIINAINKSKIMRLSRFINALGIRNVGIHASKILDQTFNGNIDHIMNADYESLIAIHEVGEIMAQSILDYFNDTNNTKIIQKCINSF